MLFRSTTADVDRVFEQYFMPFQLDSVDRCNELIPGLLDCVRCLRERDIRIATTTGYFREAATRAYASGRAQGFNPDNSLCPADVREGRPAPWMIYRNMEALGVYPRDAVVKVGDTLFDVREAQNAGVWAVGVTDSSSEIGLTQFEFAQLDDEGRRRLTAPWAARLNDAGAHDVIGTVADLPAAIQRIERRLAEGERP